MENLNEVLSRVYKNDKASNVSFYQDWINRGLNAANHLGYLSYESLVYLDGERDGFGGFTCERVIHFSDRNIFMLTPNESSYKIKVYFNPELLITELEEASQYDGTPKSAIIKFKDFEIELLKRKQLEEGSLLKVLKELPDLY